MNMEQLTLPSYHHQSNRQVEACIKFIKHTIKNFGTKASIHVALLQKRYR